MIIFVVDIVTAQNQMVFRGQSGHDLYDLLRMTVVVCVLDRTREGGAAGPEAEAATVAETVAVAAGRGRRQRRCRSNGTKNSAQLESSPCFGSSCNNDSVVYYVDTFLKKVALVLLCLMQKLWYRFYFTKRKITNYW